MRILLVEDNHDLAQTLAAVLSKQNYVVDIAADGETGGELVGVGNYDLILLDVMLPKLDGISLCRQLRSEGHQMPILLLTIKDSKTDKLMGLDAGADDVVKPFDFQILTARIRALLRRVNTTLPPILEWGNLRLDPSIFEVTYSDQALHLSAKEFSILELFLRNSKRIFSRSAIIDQLWDSKKDPPQENTIKSHIKTLRQKLKAAGANHDFIETVYGIGYRLKPLSEEQSLLKGVAKARADFQVKVDSRIAVLEQTIKALQQGQLDYKLQQKAEQEAHKLASTLRRFGFEKCSKIAYRIEDLLQTDIDQLQNFNWGEIVNKLRWEVEQTPIKATKDKLDKREQIQQLLLVVSDDKQLVEQLITEVANVGMKVKIVDSIAAARNAIVSLHPNVLLINFSCAEAIQDTLQFLAELSTATPPIPVLAFTDSYNGVTNKSELIRQLVRSFAQVNHLIPATNITNER
ncbi:MAG: response regulator transcription factor [Nostocaceae cyanobacterium]|nr:response regulator transcription factor [Nostocaceae cyanobacterium]